MAIFSELSKDLVEEILCRIPATSLKRLTCKEWNHLFQHDPMFARKHSEKAAKELMVLMLNHQFKICPMSINLHGVVPSVEVKNELTLLDPHYDNSAQFEICRVVHCDGLLLCTSRDLSKHVVWNPLTGETRWIKSRNCSREKNCTFVLGYCQENINKSYKILSYYYGGNDKDKDYSEIYEFRSDSWKTLDDNINPGRNIILSGHDVSLKGNAYWFGNYTAETPLLRFDFSTEKPYGLGPLPYDESQTWDKVNLGVVREEKLAVILKSHDTSKTEIWVTNKIDETKVVSWNKVLALDLRSCCFQFSCFGSFLVDEEKKVLVLCDKSIECRDNEDILCKDMLYIVGGDNKVMQAEVGGGTICGCWPSIILNYVPSLVSIRETKEKTGE